MPDTVGDAHIRRLLGKLSVGAATQYAVERLQHTMISGGTAMRIKLAKRNALSNVRGGAGAPNHPVCLKCILSQSKLSIAILTISASGAISLLP
jgi:hypothetical protein